MNGVSVGEAADRTGWSPRMLRYIERSGLVVPGRTGRGYRCYGLRELNQLRALRELRDRFGVEIGDVAFVLRLRAEPQLRAAVETWLAGQPAVPGAPAPAWVEWEQRKQERLLAA
ncbi:MAG: MerR family transcriptional regulator [Thermoleophilia bacterium]|nr:MerR family transcriptional regulator [Thermoleophilia bacterium]